MSILATRLVTAGLLLATSYTAFQLMFKSAPTTDALFPVLGSARRAGHFPDGIPLRGNYTGVQGFDDKLTSLVGFFSLLVDGGDEGSRRFALWFLAQLPPLIIFMFWESAKTQSIFTKVPTLYAMLAQLFTVGVVLPVYFTVHLFAVAGSRAVYPANALSKARALPFAILLGYGVPSVAFIYASPSISLDQKQIIAAVWQGFPIWISLIFNALRWLDTAVTTKFSKRSATSLDFKASRWIKGTYITSGLVAAVVNIVVFLPSLAAEDETLSFGEVFVPYVFHHLIPMPTMAVKPVGPHRLAVRLFFQRDWLAVTLAALAFFLAATVINRLVSHSRLNLAGWAACMVLIGVLGGPGASIAWAAWMLEKSSLDIPRTKTA